MDLLATVHLDLQVNIVIMVIFIGDFYQQFKGLQGKTFQQSLNVSLKYFRCFKNYNILIFYAIFQNCRKNGQSLVMFNVQCR